MKYLRLTGLVLCALLTSSVVGIVLIVVRNEYVYQQKLVSFPVFAVFAMAIISLLFSGSAKLCIRELKRIDALSRESSGSRA
jgi:NhaP-type Na+/H+ or K+/H+ antiporter